VTWIRTEYCDRCNINYPVTILAPSPECNDDQLWCGYCWEDEGWAFDWPPIERTI